MQSSDTATGVQANSLYHVFSQKWNETNKQALLFNFGEDLLILFFFKILEKTFSVNSKPDHLPGPSPGEFFERANSPSPGHRESVNPRPLGQKIVLKPHPRGQLFSIRQKKNTKHEQKLRKTVLKCKYV